MKRSIRVHEKKPPVVLGSALIDSDQALEKSPRREEPEDSDAGQATTLTLIGHFISQHKDEILSLVRKVEQIHAADNLGRIIDVKERQDAGIVIRFTAPLIGRRVGEALHSQYWGELELQQSNDGRSLNMTWWR